jgi:DNA-binding transcriptional LysR family regulator
VNIRKLDLNLLVTLEALLAERNVTRAAARLGLSQPAVSTQLARLRDVLGDPLLLPAQRGMIPTARALELERPLRAALDEVREVMTHGASFDPASADMTLSIAASDYGQYAVLMGFALDLCRRAPGIRLALRALDGRLLAKQMEAGEVDLGIITTTTAPTALRARHLLTERYVAIVRRDHPTVRRTMTLDAFLALEHVVVSPRGSGFRGPTDDALEALGLRRKVVLSVGSFLVVPEIVARSDLAALVPERIVRHRADALRLLEPPIEVAGYSMSLVWHERSHQHPGHRWARDALVQAVQQVDA